MYETKNLQFWRFQYPAESQFVYIDRNLNFTGPQIHSKQSLYIITEKMQHTSITRQIMKQVKESKQYINEGIVLMPNPSNIFHLKGWIQGPQGSPYEGGTFEIDIHIPQDYPFRRPVIRFVTKIYRPNVRQSGQVALCSSFYDESWYQITATIQLILLYRIQEMKTEQQIKQQMNEYSKEVDAIKYKSIKSKTLKVENQLDRLTNQKFYNPYDVLQLDAAANEDQIKKQFKAFAIILHPDKCRDPRAKDAWHTVEQSYKTLNDPEKRKVYLRIMREARERTQFEREKQNKKRIKSGQMPLPESTFQEQYQETCQKIFMDIEEKKDHITKLQQSTINRKMEELQTKKIIEQFRVLTEEEWERSRQKRVSNWRQFSNKKYVVGSKRSNGGIRPPPAKAEHRPHYAKLDDRNKNL